MDVKNVRLDNCPLCGDEHIWGYDKETEEFYFEHKTNSLCPLSMCFVDDMEAVENYIKHWNNRITYWNPIETCPKDEEYYLIKDSCGEVYKGFWLARWNCYVWNVLGDEDFSIIHFPTGWTNLPKEK